VTAVFARPVLDRVLEVEPGARARGLRNVPSTLQVFESHFPRFPVLPGVLVLDTLAELARLALPGPADGWRLAGVERVQFRRYVSPGDQLELTVEVRRAGDGTATLRGDARVAGRVVVVARQIELVREASPS
jgi:3-hydroxyacyl-[acyl-carrier-protein] dehydratase